MYHMCAVPEEGRRGHLSPRLECHVHARNQSTYSEPLSPLPSPKLLGLITMGLMHGVITERTGSSLVILLTSKPYNKSFFLRLAISVRSHGSIAVSLQMSV